jgi:quinol monooxygenase YgiN
MTLLIIRMNVLSEKRTELSQTIASLSSSIRMEKGCQRCDFCRSVEYENRFVLLEEWDTRENLKNHMKSEHFKVIRGAINLLQEPYEAMFHTVLNLKGRNAHPNSKDSKLVEEGAL